MKPETIHVSNAAFNEVFSQQEHRLPHFVVATSYCDENAVGWNQALKLCAFLQEYCPNLVFIATGDYVEAECGHPECEVVDGLFRLIIVPEGIWEAHRNKVLERDRLWHKWARKCKRVS